MTTYTNHYNLEKPAQTDVYNVDVFNANADKVDAALYGKSDNSNIATVESSNVASKNYVVGELLVLNGILYTVTSAIATGGTITPDSNCTSTNVGSEIKTVKESLSTLITTDSVSCPAVSYAAGVAGAYMGYLTASAAKTGYTPIAATTEMIGHPGQYTVDTVLDGNNVNFVFRRTNNTAAISYNAGEVRAIVAYVKTS